MVRGLIALLLLLAAPQFACAQIVSGNADMHASAAVLRAGQFRWAQVEAFEEPVSIAISITLQRMYVYRGDTLIAVASVSTGKSGHRTPMGSFTTIQKARWHRSNIYSNAPMPFMQRLTWTGIALHAGHNPGFPASHGCIRMPYEFARDLFDIVPLGSLVTITDYPPETPVYLEVADLGLGLGEPRLSYSFAALG